jgi:hypothetical protein
LWTAVRDERPYGSTAPPAAFYLYSADRTSEHAHALLKGCRGHLHADGYTGFGGLYEADLCFGVQFLMTFFKRNLRAPATSSRMRRGRYMFGEVEVRTPA